jgi:hypothetical protein
MDLHMDEDGVWLLNKAELESKIVLGFLPDTVLHTANGKRRRMDEGCMDGRSGG